MTVTVPPEFAAIGYSGLFHLDFDMDMTPDQVEQWRAKAPYLLGNTGWMVLEVTDEPRAILVRRDSNAICDLVFQRRTDPIMVQKRSN